MLPSYEETLSLMSPEEAARTAASVMRLRVQGVGCAPSGVGSWLSSAVRSVVRPIASVVAPAVPGATAALPVLNALFPDRVAPSPAPAPAPAPAAAPASNALLIVGGVLLAGFLLFGRRR